MRSHLVDLLKQTSPQINWSVIRKKLSSTTCPFFSMDVYQWRNFGSMFLLPVDHAEHSEL